MKTLVLSVWFFVILLLTSSVSYGQSRFDRGLVIYHVSTINLRSSVYNTRVSIITRTPGYTYISTTRYLYEYRNKAHSSYRGRQHTINVPTLYKGKSPAYWKAYNSTAEFLSNQNKAK